jgi:lipoate-protein ligase A
MQQTESWRLLVSPPLPGALNMAIDHMLLETYAATSRPTLRFYQWTPPCLSLGLAQRLERDVNLEACVRLGIDVVRRQTGGRAILHDREVTYALVMPIDHPLIGGQAVAQSYRAISEALCIGLLQLGITVDLAPRPDPGQSKSAACFDVPSDYEITADGRKLVGSAQARQHGVLLQHGSILLHSDVDRLVEVLRLPPTLGPDMLAQRLTALNELAAPLSFDAVVAALIRGLEQSWGVQLVADKLTQAEEQRAAELVKDKYGNLAWTGRR